MVASTRNVVAEVVVVEERSKERAYCVMESGSDGGGRGTFGLRL